MFCEGLENNGGEPMARGRYSQLFVTIKSSKSLAITVTEDGHLQGRGRGLEFTSLTALRRRQLNGHLDFRLPASQTARPEPSVTQGFSICLVCVPLWVPSPASQSDDRPTPFVALCYRPLKTSHSRGHRPPSQGSCLCLVR